jgi:aspartyl-tRNA(Asn)/glutamyl-tRNA(Gln) amidotransferase subunit A
MPTYAGTPRALPDKWTHDAWLVRRLREAGAIMVGKTHMVEMAYGGVGINPHWDTPYNPWDRRTHRAPGGSSSGAGVSLHEGSALVALGSDTGGSIRIPAALTGTVGERCTRGRWPTDGAVPLSSTLDTVGALTRTVEDYVWFFGTVDPAHGDPAALLTALAATELRGLRLARPACRLWDDCQPDIARVLQDAVDELRAAGIDISDEDGGLLDEAFRLSMGGRPIASSEVLDFVQRELPDWLDLFHPIVGDRMRGGLPLDAPGYLAARAEQRELESEAEDLFRDADILVLPTNIVTPPPVEAVARMEVYAEANAAILRPTYPISILGLCAISIPVGLDESGMPVGLQLVARGGRDEQLLGVALAAERVLGTAASRLGTPPLLA